MNVPEITGYRWGGSNLTCAHEYLLPTIFTEMTKLKPVIRSRRVFDLGCGNGSFANKLSKEGWDVTGVDPSIEGVETANKYYSHLNIEQGSAYDDLYAKYGRYPIVISLEVVEHVYFPRLYAKTLYSLLESGGTAIISTPYHGYWKNIALAVSGKMDNHFTALWDHGHIKFWSVKTISILLKEAGFTDIQFKFVGRIPVLAKAMIVIAKK